MKLGHFLWFFSFVYLAFYLNGKVVALNNQLEKSQFRLETMTYQFNMCKKLYKMPLTCPKK